MGEDSVAIKLGEMLLSRGLITRSQLEEALLGQKQFGGRLGTNLVEMGLITEELVASCLSEQLGVPHVRPQALAAIPRDVIARLSRELAEKYRVVPLRLEREMHVAMADPHSFDRIDELAFAVGMRLRPYVVTEVSLNYALERYYGLRREVRHLSAMQFGLRPTPVFGVPITDIAAADTPPALQVAPQAPSVIDQLAAVMNTPDVARALMQYFGEVFPAVLLFRVLDGAAVPIEVAHEQRRGPTKGLHGLSLHSTTWLGALVGKPQVFYRREVNDPDLLQLLPAMAISPHDLTLVPVLDGAQAMYIVAGQGRDEVYLRGALSGIRKFLGKAGQALRVVALRDEIRAE